MSAIGEAKTDRKEYRAPPMGNADSPTIRRINKSAESTLLRRFVSADQMEAISRCHDLLHRRNLITSKTEIAWQLGFVDNTAVRLVFDTLTQTSRNNVKWHLVRLDPERKPRFVNHMRVYHIDTKTGFEQVIAIHDAFIRRNISVDLAFLALKLGLVSPSYLRQAFRDLPLFEFEWKATPLREPRDSRTDGCRSASSKPDTQVLPRLSLDETDAKPTTSVSAKIDEKRQRRERFDRKPKRDRANMTQQIQQYKMALTASGLLCTFLFGMLLGQWRSSSGSPVTPSAQQNPVATTGNPIANDPVQVAIEQPKTRKPSSNRRKTRSRRSKRRTRPPVVLAPAPVALAGDELKPAKQPAEERVVWSDPEKAVLRLIRAGLPDSVIQEFMKLHRIQFSELDRKADELKSYDLSEDLYAFIQKSAD